MLATLKYDATARGYELRSVRVNSCFNIQARELFGLGNYYFRAHLATPWSTFCAPPRISRFVLRDCWLVKNMNYQFYGNTTDLYTNVLERTPVLYSRGQLSIIDPSKTIMNEWQSYIRWLSTALILWRYPSTPNRDIAPMNKVFYTSHRYYRDSSLRIRTRDGEYQNLQEGRSYGGFAGGSVPVHPAISLLANGGTPFTNNNHFSGGASPLVNGLVHHLIWQLSPIHQQMLISW